MTNNPILDELHAARERLLAECGGTVSTCLTAFELIRRHFNVQNTNRRITKRCTGAAKLRRLKWKVSRRRPVIANR